MITARCINDARGLQRKNIKEPIFMRTLEKPPRGGPLDGRGVGGSRSMTKVSRSG